jgi:hypothetical protein
MQSLIKEFERRQIDKEVAVTARTGNRISIYPSASKLLKCQPR